MGTPRDNLLSEHTTAQAQIIYFLLGLAASAIAFAVHETEGAALRDTPWPLGGAVMLWAISFAMGCVSVKARQRAIITNLAFLESTKGLNSAQIEKCLPNSRKITQEDINRPFKYFDRQLWTFFAGAMFYIGGHVMQMAATPSKFEHAVASPTPTGSRASEHRPAP